MKQNISRLILLSALALAGCANDKEIAESAPLAAPAPAQEQTYADRVRAAISSNQMHQLMLVAQESERELKPDKRKTLILEAIKSDNAEVLYQLGQNMGSKPVTKFELLSSAAKKGHAGALFQLSQCYENGQGTLMDASKSKAVLLESAHLGNADAQMKLSGNYFRGMNGFEENKTEATAWAMVAHANGSEIMWKQGDENLPAVRARAEELWKTCKAR